MDNQKFKRLRRLAAHCKSGEDFIRELCKFARSYGVPLWTKEHYRQFYNKIKGGTNYDKFTREEGFLTGTKSNLQ